jgi:hypothetical protein
MNESVTDVGSVHLLRACNFHDYMNIVTNEGTYVIRAVIMGSTILWVI